MTSTASYSIEDSHGTASGQGIQDWDAAVAAARHHVERTGATWYVTGTDEDGDEIEPYAVEPAVEVVSVSTSDTVETEGAVDATVMVSGEEYQVTLIPSEHDGELSSWGDIDHWISGPDIRSLSRERLVEIEMAVRAAAAEMVD